MKDALDVITIGPHPVEALARGHPSLVVSGVHPGMGSSSAWFPVEDSSRAYTASSSAMVAMGVCLLLSFWENQGMCMAAAPMARVTTTADFILLVKTGSGRMAQSGRSRERDTVVGYPRRPSSQRNHGRFIQGISHLVPEEQSQYTRPLPMIFPDGKLQGGDGKGNKKNPFSHRVWKEDIIGRRYFVSQLPVSVLGPDVVQRGFTRQSTRSPHAVRSSEHLRLLDDLKPGV